MIQGLSALALLTLGAGHRSTPGLYTSDDPSCDSPDSYLQTLQLGPSKSAPAEIHRCSRTVCDWKEGRGNGNMKEWVSGRVGDRPCVVSIQI